MQFDQTTTTIHKVWNREGTDWSYFLVYPKGNQLLKEGPFPSFIGASVRYYQMTGEVPRLSNLIVYSEEN